MENKYNIESSIESIIKQWPKTDDCEFQTLGELREWQIKELKKLFNSNEKRYTKEDMLNFARWYDSKEENNCHRTWQEELDEWIEIENL